MGHVVFAAPSIARFHLHERVARALRARGHRVTVLAPDPVVFDFYSAQGLPTWRVKPGPCGNLETPLDSFAELDCLLSGIRRPSFGQLGRSARALLRYLGGLIRFFEIDTPDIVVLHQNRDGMHRLLHFLGREFGCGVLWTGDGLVPGTMQVDAEGLDADAASCRRSGRDYRSVPARQDLLAATLASLLGGARPTPLSRCQVRAPAMRSRLATALSLVGRRHGHGLLGGIDSWRAALPPLLRRPPAGDLPDKPFIAVLLQHPLDPRVCLDAPVPWSPLDLVRRAVEAAADLDPELAIVAIPPDGGLPRRHLEAIGRIPGVVLQPAATAALATTTALAAITVNHPAGVVSLLAGTPLLHTGRALYSLRDISTRTTLDSMVEDLPGSLQDERPYLRARFLTWLLSEGHLWCWPDFPDHNGINGLVQKIESAMRHEASGVGISYRAGPVWPLQESAG